MRLAYLTVVNTFTVLGLLLAADRDKDTEILVLRHQIAVLERQLGGKKVRFTPADRAWLTALLHRLGPRPRPDAVAGTPRHGAALAPRPGQ
jgi:putative transposase